MLLNIRAGDQDHPQTLAPRSLWSLHQASCVNASCMMSKFCNDSLSPLYLTSRTDLWAQ